MRLTTFAIILASVANLAFAAEINNDIEKRVYTTTWVIEDNPFHWSSYAITLPGDPPGQPTKAAKPKPTHTASPSPAGKPQE